MAESSIEMPPLPRQADCCADPDVATQTACGLCTRPTCRKCGGYVNSRPVCKNCVAQIQQELDAERADASHIPGGLIGGVIGALLGGGIWAAVAIVTNLAIGYLAVLVGFLAGYGVFLGAGKRKSKQLQYVAVGCAFLGLVLGKYFIVAHVIMKKYPNDGLSYLDSRVFHVFTENFSKFFEAFDFLWMFLALGAAVRATKPTLTRLRTPRTPR